ncbi:MAG: DUF2062 domain-containing protein [Candidatus Methylacidiphilales bacterium]|nr:DUF2062 domain-containing protein [Candidatus Methylacidiphilales bacterium]
MKTLLGFLLKIWQWFWDHIRKIGELQGKKEAIAGGVAIGFFVGFTPFFGIKTVIAMGLAWLCGCHVVAAAIAVTLHDISWPILPLLFYLEYDIGYWLLNNPHHLPSHGGHLLEHHSVRQLLSFAFWQTTGLPLLVGSLVLGAIGAPISYFVTMSFLKKIEQKRNARRAAEAAALKTDEAEAEDLHHERKPAAASASASTGTPAPEPDDKDGSGI